MQGKQFSLQTSMLQMCDFPFPNQLSHLTHLHCHSRSQAAKQSHTYLASFDNRTQGWNLAVKSTFASKADMDYYDTECEAHKELKKITGAIRTDIVTVWFENALEDIPIPS
jgi:hypothetical protein